MESSNKLMPIAVPAEAVAEPVVVEKKKKRVMSDAQREGLKKGLDALKAKREAIAKAKEEAKAKLVKPIAEQIQPIEPIKDQSPADNPLVSQIRRRNRIPKVDITDFAKFKEDVIQNLSQIKNTPVPVQEKVVEKQVYLTGSDLLNKIFNFNS
jgi:hypothetical protein